MKIRADENQYRLLGSRPYQRKDGAMSELSDWESDCASCGAPFVVSLPVSQTPATKAVNRRCERCKAAGKPATSRAQQRQNRWRYATGLGLRKFDGV